jgi:DNA-binding IclR family transcriptional regulator
MSGMKRYSDVLRLFSETRSSWTIADIASELAVPQSTIYRTVRDLSGDGFLELATDGRCRLGPSFIEFDRLIRVTDPLLRAGEPLLAELAEQAGIACVTVLARLYGTTVMCVADASTQERSVHTSYERGRPRPLTRGATSKAILAQLPARRLGRLLDMVIRSGHIRSDELPGLRDELALIRKRGYSITRAEVDAGLVGIAVPVSSPRQALVASLSIVVENSSFSETTRTFLISLLAATAKRLGEDTSFQGALAPTIGSCD